MPEFADAGVQDATPVGPLVTVLQVVTKNVPLVPGVHEATPVGPVVVVAQVVVV